MMKKRKTMALWLILTAATSCSTNSSLWSDEPQNQTDPVPLTFNFSIRSSTEKTEIIEADWPHILYMFQTQNGKETCVAVQEQKTAKELTPFSLKKGDYTFVALIINNTEKVTFSQAPKEGKSSITNTITLNQTKATPEILYSKQLINVTQAESKSVMVTRLVGQLAMTVTGVPLIPAIDSITVKIDSLYNRIALDSTYSVSSKAEAVREITLKPSAISGSFTNTLDNMGKTTAGDILMPSITGNTAIPLQFKLHYTNGKTGTASALAPGRIEANTRSIIQGTLTNQSMVVDMKVSYASWITQTDSIKIEIPLDPEVVDKPIDTDTPIGNIKDGGIVFSAGKVLALIESTDSMTWKEAQTWTENQGNGYELATKEEWAAIDLIQRTLNTKLESTAGAVILKKDKKYWTSSLPVTPPYHETHAYVHTISNGSTPRPKELRNYARAVKVIYK